MNKLHIKEVYNKEKHIIFVFFYTNGKFYRVTLTKENITGENN